MNLLLLLKACPVNKLTTEKLAQAFIDLAGPELQAAALSLQESMLRENGIEGGLAHFLDCLPRQNMLCDVSLLLGETEMARYELIGTRIPTHGIKVSPEVAAFLEAEEHFVWSWKSFCRKIPSTKTIADRQIYGHGIRRHSISNYNLAGHIHMFHHGLIAACTGAIGGLISAGLQFYKKPDRYARTSGAFGCLYGLFVAVFYVAIDVCLAFVVFVDRLAIAFTNGVFGKHYEYIIDPRRRAKVNDLPLISGEKERILKHGIPRARRRELRRAIDMVANARRIFERCCPSFPHDHQSFLVVSLPKLEATLTSAQGMETLSLTKMEAAAVAERLHSYSLPQLSSVRKYSVISGPADRGNCQDFNVTATLESAKGMLQNLVSKVNPFSRSKPEETEISFSLFIQSLQKTYTKKCSQNNGRREMSPSVGLDREGFQREFSEFLN